jgi:ribosome-dependent ATPase
MWRWPWGLCGSGDADRLGAAVPLHGSLLALVLGGLLYELAATSLGLMISCFVRSQVAAIFATALICLIPSVNFSGLLYPVSTLSGATAWIAAGFPATWFQTISLGTFTKGLALPVLPRPIWRWAALRWSISRGRG